MFALGDMVRVLGEDGEPQHLLGVAPVAMQQGRYAAKLVKARLRGQRPRARSATATRATSRRSAARGPSPTSRRVTVSGFPAWVTWLVIHLWYLIGFQNRLLVLIRWSFSFFTRGRGGRVIEHVRRPQGVARPPS